MSTVLLENTKKKCDDELVALGAFFVLYSTSRQTFQRAQDLYNPAARRANISIYFITPVFARGYFSYFFHREEDQTHDSKPQPTVEYHIQNEAEKVSRTEPTGEEGLHEEPVLPGGSYRGSSARIVIEGKPRRGSGGRQTDQPKEKQLGSPTGLWTIQLQQQQSTQQQGRDCTRVCQKEKAQETRRVHTGPQDAQGHERPRTIWFAIRTRRVLSITVSLRVDKTDTTPSKPAETRQILETQKTSTSQNRH